MATTIVRHEHELNVWTHATRAPDPRLAPLTYRPLLGFEQERAEFGSCGCPLRGSLASATLTAWWSSVGRTFR
jgi:hypothetical protein